MREDPRESQGSALVRGKTPLEILDEVIQKTLKMDEYIEHEARIMYTYRMLSM